MDNFSWILGAHTVKVGGDINFVSIPRAHFELNFAGLFNFGNFAASNLNGGFAGLPDFTPVQSYGLGLPSTFIQGFGNPDSVIKNTPLAFFAQDTWSVDERLTLNYGIRYDVELTETIAPVAFRDPLTGINLAASDILAAQDALNVQQGFPRDTNNWAPRFGFAYDFVGNGKTVMRGSIGLYYDHPLLAKSMCQSLNFGEDDVETTNALSLFGKEVFDFLYPETFWEQSPVIPENVSWNFKPSSASNIPSFPDFGQPLPVPVKPEIDRNNGSNNWASPPLKP